MKPVMALTVGAVAVAGALGAGYWFGQSGRLPPAAGAAATASGAGAEAARKPPKLLYYRNPMGLPDTSPVPKKDPMGMDYIAVFEGDADSDVATARQLRISTDKVQKLGVRTEAVQRRTLDRTIRAAGRVEPDERRSVIIAPKFEGYIERLHVNVTGQPVVKGQALFEVYSPELVSLQREYAIAAQGVISLKGADSPAQLGMARLVESALQRLKNWDISEPQIKALVASGESQRTLTFRSPATGVVTEKKAVQGMRFMPGEVLYQVSDLSVVWVIADIFEQDIALVKTGIKAQIRINAYPEQVFEGQVTYVYPTLKAETRTVPVRIELANRAGLLKPAMYAQVELLLSGRAAVLTVPTSAVIDSGTRQIVLVQVGAGRFEPRQVKLGQRSDSVIEVLDGVQEGEAVVVAANFLIDAESNLKAALGGLGPAPTARPGTETAAATPLPKGSGHQADGTVESIDAKSQSVTLSHGPVASLKWPAMTMEFKLAHAALLKDLKPGAKVTIEFVERQAGEWVITGIKPLGNAPAAPPAPAAAARAHPHLGH